MRWLWLGAGLVCVGVAVAGIVLPLVPTTPLLLLAAFCFARSSERLHHWLLCHPRFGPVIEDWRERGAIAPRAKRLATASIAVVPLISLGLGLAAWVLVVQLLVLGAVLGFIWTRPNS
ncbi:MAG: YbaN family protein [Roseovarius sp.]